MIEASCHCGAVRFEVETIPGDPAHERMGVNARLMAPEALAAIPTRHSDGALM